MLPWSSFHSNESLKGVGGGDNKNSFEYMNFWNKRIESASFTIATLVSNERWEGRQADGSLEYIEIVNSLSNVSRSSRKLLASFESFPFSPQWRRVAAMTTGQLKKTTSGRQRRSLSRKCLLNSDSLHPRQSPPAAVALKLERTQREMLNENALLVHGTPETCAAFYLVYRQWPASYCSVIQ